MEISLPGKGGGEGLKGTQNLYLVGNDLMVTRERKAMWMFWQCQWEFVFVLFLLKRLIQSISRLVCLYVDHTLETLPEGLETSGRRAYR